MNQLAKYWKLPRQNFEFESGGIFRIIKLSKRSFSVQLSSNIGVDKMGNAQAKKSDTTENGNSLDYFVKFQIKTTWLFVEKAEQLRLFLRAVI